MFINSINAESKPFKSPGGEKVFELIGAPEHLGGASMHSLAIGVLEPGTQSQKHYNVSEESYYILTGQITVLTTSATYHLKKGEACLIERRHTHQAFNKSKETAKFIVVSAPAFKPEDMHLVK